jgi:integrase
MRPSGSGIASQRSQGRSPSGGRPAVGALGVTGGMASNMRARSWLCRHRHNHDLRHSAATFLFAQGMALEDVKNQLGHSTIVLTSNTYGHVLEQRQRQVARAMDAVLGG